MEQGNTGFMGSLSLGYNFLFNQQVMLGLQFDGQISGVKTEHQATTTFLIKQQLPFWKSIIKVQ